MEITVNGKSPLNPSQSATKRVKDALPIPYVCNVCNGDVRLARHEEVYGGRTFGEWPWVYLCECCGAYVGIHKFTNIPLGTLADSDTRKARTHCKKPFQFIWDRGMMGRTELYQWLARHLNIPMSQCHFSMFTISQCRKAHELCTKFIEMHADRSDLKAWKGGYND